MKKMIMIALVAFGMNAKAQTIDTAFHQILACKIHPFKAKFSDTANVTHLGVNVVNDNLMDSATVIWVLLDDKKNPLVTGRVALTGRAYTSYNSYGNISIFTYIASLYSQVQFL